MEHVLLNLGDLLLIFLVIMIEVTAYAYKSKMLHELKMHDKISEYKKYENMSFLKIMYSKSDNKDGSISPLWLILCIVYIGIYSFTAIRIIWKILIVVENLLIGMRLSTPIISF